MDPFPQFVFSKCWRRLVGQEREEVPTTYPELETTKSQCPEPENPIPEMLCWVQVFLPPAMVISSQAAFR